MNETLAAARSNAAMHNILVVDDEEIVLVALRDTLEHEGYNVVTCSSAVQALTILKEQVFSVIISDQQMPTLTGLEFLAQVKQIQPDATRILITAVLSLSTVIDAINKGEIYRFVVKPWLREDLLATVRNAVQRYELICKNLVLQATTRAMNEKLTRLNKSLEDQVANFARQNEELTRLTEGLDRNVHHAVELCVRSLETFYPILGSQARRAFELCRAMAQHLQLPPQKARLLEIAAWLHDIGLLGVPHNLIKHWQESPATLTAAERALFEQHPILGQEMVRFEDPLNDVGTIIRAHHERFDGTGYPDCLQGENIPWLARLLSVAAWYAASHRDHKKTVTLIESESGAAFDPEAVRAFVHSLPEASLPRREREVDLSELEPGMVLARGVYVENGMLLVPEGQLLSAAYIEKLRRHDRVSPISQTLLVYY